MPTFLAWFLKEASVKEILMWVLEVTNILSLVVIHYYRPKIKRPRVTFDKTHLLPLLFS